MNSRTSKPMQLSMRTFLLSISLLAIILIPTHLYGQKFFPTEAGEKVKYDAMIEMPKAYISGICIMLNDSTEIKGSIFNEFGVSAIDFSFAPQKDKVKLHHVMGMMNKWYIKKILRKDLCHLMHNLQKGIGSYKNEKYDITYSFTPMNIDQNYEEHEVAK